MKIRHAEVKHDHLCLFSDPTLKSIPNNLETTQKVLSYDIVNVLINTKLVTKMK